MKERIKKLRKTLNLTQQAFADRIGIKGNAISQYESGRNEPIDAVVSLICREFNVSEKWLRTGEGEMFVQRSRADELSMFVEQLLQSEPNDIRRRFVTAISHLSTHELEILERTALHLADEPNVAISSAIPDIVPVSNELGQKPTENEKTEKKKKPIPVDGDGLDELEEFVRIHKKNLTAFQEQQIVNMMQAMIAPQKEPLSASAQQIVDGTAPKIENPIQS